MSKFKIFAAGLVTLTTGAILAACGNKSATNSNSATLNTSTPNEISTLDSSKYGDTTSSEILQNSMEGLYRFDKNNKPQLAGASSVSRSKDQKIYTFTLRKNAKWSNGDPVVAKDYVTGWQRTVDPKNQSLDADSYAIIKNGDAIAQGKESPNKLGIKAIGKYKLQVTLENPIPYLPQILEGAQFYPQDTKLVKRYGSKYGTSSDKLAYNGPFVVQGWTGSNLKWNLKKNNTYWNKKIVSLNKVNYQVVKEASTGINMFKSNEIDYTPLSSAYVKQYRNNDEYHSQVTPTNGYMSFNLKRKVPGNVHVRRAISQAINKKQLVNNVLFAGKVSNGIVASNFITDQLKGFSSTSNGLPATSFWTTNL